MRLQYILLLLFPFLFCQGQEDFNLELIANVDYPEIGNDIWGYVSDEGIEYALVGTQENVRIYNLSNPSAPLLVGIVNGSFSVWRDIKTWDSHVYITTGEANDGLLIIDMSRAPIIDHKYWKPEINNEALDYCHNLYIDENGFMYLAGCNPIGANKAIIFDLNRDKWNPELVGVHGGPELEYAHDLMVQDNIMYSSEIRKGSVVLYDVTDKADILYLGEAATSFETTHNAWVSRNDKYLYTTDERRNGFVDSYDISDLTNIKRLDQFQPLATRNRDVVPHNTHFKDNYLITSWYTDGVVVIDAAHPDNLIKVGSFDTWDGPHGGFNGCWGAYPYLPSGLILANDKNDGLFILKPVYVRACHLEGTVLDASTCQEINGVKISILSDLGNRATSNAVGHYKTGIASAGKFDVKFSHPDYLDKYVEVELENGILRTLNVSLVGENISLDEKESATFDIFPNPSKEFLNIDTNIDYLRNVELFNTLGQKVYSSIESRSIDVSSFSSGTYLLRIESYCGDNLSRMVIIN